MPELAEVEKPKVAGYVDPRPKNKNKQRIEEAEKELEQLSSQAQGDGVSETTEKVTNTEVSETDSKDEILSKEEQTFKKRYGDLRRHLADKEKSFIISGTGDVLEPEGDVIGIGSGGNYALAAAKVLMDTELKAEEVAKKAIQVAADICVFTNHNIRVEKI